MAQGAVKKSAAAVVPKGSHAKNKPMAGAKNSRVQKNHQIHKKADKLQRKLAGGLTSRTEKLLGERAGHLELIGPGKKAGRGLTKGGSKRFG